MEHLLYATGVAVLELAQFADSKVKDGTMDKNRLVMPGWHRMKKWIRSCFNEEDGQANSQNPDHSESGTCTVYIGDAYKAKRDPEHLPPKNAWQNFGNIIRTIPKF